MDPAPSFLPEMDPNGSGNHAKSGAQISPQVSPQNPHQHVHRLRPVEMPRNEVKSYQKNYQQVVQHLPVLVRPTQAQAQASSIGLNFLPAARPPPLCLQALSPGAVPKLLCTPCSPPPSYWVPPASPHWLSSHFGFRSYLLHPFSSPPEFLCNPWLFPPILCPQMMPIHQTGRASGSMQILVTPASERRKEHAGTQGQRSTNHVIIITEDEQNKPQEGNPGSYDKPGRKRKIDSPGLSPLWYEELMEEDGFEECMKLLASFFDQVKKIGVACSDTGTQKVEKDSLLTYLDELCSNKDFARKVESFMPSPSSGKDLLDVSAQEQREQEMQEGLPSLPASSDPVSEETAPLSYEEASQVLLLDPPGIQSAASPKQQEQNSPKTENRICGSPLMPSHLLEEPPPADAAAEGPVKYPPPEKSQTCLDACSAPSHDEIFMPMMHSFPNTSKVSDLESGDEVDTALSLSLMEIGIQTMPEAQPVGSTSTTRQEPNLSDLLTESLQKSACQPPHPQPPAPIGKPKGHLSSWFDAAHDLSFAVHSDPDSFSETGVNKNLLARRKTKHSQEDRRTGKSSSEGEIEGMKLQATEFVLQNSPMISPVKKSSSMRGGEENAGAAKIREKTVSACPTKETKAPLDEGREPERLSSCWNLTSANTSVTTSGSPPTWCRKRKNVFESTVSNVRPTVQTSTASSPKPSPGAGAQDNEESCGERPTLTGSPVKRRREASGVRGQSADNARMINKQLQPKKAQRGNKGMKTS